jgi:hypothetical protein
MCVIDNIVRTILWESTIIRLIFRNFVRTIPVMETPKRGPGRPPKDPAGSKDARLEFRVSESEKTLLERAAETEGESVSDWGRRVLVRAAKRSIAK